jgi:hypothetical protein
MDHFSLNEELYGEIGGGGAVRALLDGTQTTLGDQRAGWSKLNGTVGSPKMTRLRTSNALSAASGMAIPN